VSREETPEPWPLAASKSPKEHREALIFLHIPKTGGDDRQPDYRVAIQPFCDFHDGSLSDQGDSGTTQTTSRGAPSPVAVVRGHLFYGIHECLPQGATHITMLREPMPGFSPLIILFCASRFIRCTGN
jgi:hypothetical protein